MWADQGAVLSATRLSWKPSAQRDSNGARYRRIANLQKRRKYQHGEATVVSSKTRQVKSKCEAHVYVGVILKVCVFMFF